MYVARHVKFPLFLSDFNDSQIFSTDFRNILAYQISLNFVEWKQSWSVRVGRRTHGDRQTYRQTDWNDEANTRCRQFCDHIQRAYSVASTFCTTRCL